MIIGNNFSWAHIGKTGGDSVHKMFSICDIAASVDDVTTNLKHDTFKYRLELIANKKRILTIRKLPNWILSRAMHTKIHLGIDFTKEELIRGIIKWPNTQTTADAHLLHYEPEKVDYWLRTEYLAEDFIKAFSNFFNINNAQKTLILNTHENICKDNYNKSYFSDEELKQLYENCPVWTKYEKQVFGSLVV